MTLLVPGLALAGGLAIALPILIHLLFRQRRKPVAWGAMRFLLEAYRRHRRRLQLEQWLLLALRCLVIGLLGLGLARPLLQAAPVASGGGSRTVVLVIDTGLISGVLDDDAVPALDRLVETAHALLD